jgi:hypothetical protein
MLKTLAKMLITFPLPRLDKSLDLSSLSRLLVARGSPVLSDQPGGFRAPGASTLLLLLITYIQILFSSYSIELLLGWGGE